MNIHLFEPEFFKKVVGTCWKNLLKRKKGKTMNSLVEQKVCKFLVDELLMFQMFQIQAAESLEIKSVNCK